MTTAALHVVAIVTWFHPDASAHERLHQAATQCDSVLVVDNTPTGSGVPGSPPQVRYLPLGGNHGLAGALNAGLQVLPEAYDAVLLLDQDSTLQDGAVGLLSRHLQRSAVGIAAPTPWDEEEHRWVDPRAHLRPEVAEVDAVITSGMLIRRACLDGVGGFREDFFVDAVDQDFCLRARSAGWLIVQDRSVRLAHRLGATRWHRLAGLRVRATHHTDWRLYSGARNGAVLIREHAARRPRWAVVNSLQLLYWLVTVIAFEPPRPRRAARFLTGLLHGLRGVPLELPPGAVGPGAA